MLKAFFFVLILASGLRFTALTFDSLWLDENYQTVVESYGNNLPDLLNPEGKAFIYKSDNPASVHNVLTRFRKVDPLCPPLFAVCMNRWITAFGGSDFALRGFAVLMFNTFHYCYLFFWFCPFRQRLRTICCPTASDFTLRCMLCPGSQNV